MGPPGSGKTTLANQIAFAAAHRSQRTLVLAALSEPTGKLIEHLRAYQFFDADLVGDLVQFLSLQQFLSGGLATTGEEIIAAAREERAGFVVLDGFRGVRGATSDPQMVRQFLYDVGTTLSLQGATTIITSEANAHDPAWFPEMTTADVIICLHYNLVGVRHQRGVEIIKMRAGNVLPGLHSIAIDDSGVVVYPRLEARMGIPRQRTLYSALGRAGTGEPEPVVAPTAPGRVSFDLPELDELLHGGLTPHTCTLLAGSLGVGKTLLGLQFALAGIRAHEPTLFLGFRETPEQLLQNADAFAMGEELRAALRSDGLLGMLRWEPVELDPDITADRLLAVLDRTGTRRLIVDSIIELEHAVATCTGSGRMPDFMAALLATLRARGVTTLIIKETRKVIGPELDLSSDPISMLAENVLFLQQVPYQGKLHHVLAALKTRLSAHEYTLREFAVERHQGIRVLTPNESGIEVLSGITGQ
jgi:circadian clock protein KaiC